MILLSGTIEGTAFLQLSEVGANQSSLSELFIAANSASLACKAARQVELSRAGEGDAFLVKVVLDKLLGKNLFLISAFLFHDD